MDLDVLYKVPKDLCWRYINRFVDSSSVDIALYRACLDSFICKKTLWKIISRLKKSGILCISCEAENISDVIKLISEKGYNYRVVYFIKNSSVCCFLICYKNKLYKPKIKGVIRISSWEEIGYTLCGLSSYGQIALCVSDYTMPIVPVFKKMSRYVVALGNAQLFTQQITNQGIKEVLINE